MSTPLEPTRRDPAGEPATGAPPPTRRDTVPGTGPSTLLRLPAALAGEYTVVGDLPGGAEADVVRVRDGGGGEFVVKVYRPGVTIDEDAARLVQRLDPGRLVVPVRVGEEAGRRWELSDYLPAGSLAAVADGPWPAGRVTEVVAQLAEALGELHRAGIVHGDLKPANVLLRSLDPLDLALTDFGLAKYLGESSVRFTSRGFTISYAAPESLAGTFSRPGDWWAVGMIARQLCTGLVPFAGLREQVIVHELMVRDVPVQMVADERLRLLCGGLLTREPERRWGAAEVRRWLDGESPPVDRTRRVAVPLDVAGTPCRTRGEAARAMAANWEWAQEEYLSRLGTATDPGEGWRVLREWLGQFDDADRVGLIDRVLTVPANPPPVRLAHLLRWLDRSLPPTYRGLRLTPGDVPAVAVDPAARPVVGDLWRYRLLPVLAGFDGGAELAAIDEEWRRLAARFAELVDGGDLPAPLREAMIGDAAQYRATLLLFAADPAAAGTHVERAATAKAGVDAAPAWFAALDPAADSASALVTTVAVAYARAEAERRAGERERARQIWQRERGDLGKGRPRAIGYALAAIGIWAGVCAMAGRVATGTVTDWLLPDSANELQVSLAVAGGCWLVMAAGELTTAWTLGARYHPASSALNLLRREARRVPALYGGVRRLGNRVRVLPPLAVTAGCCLLIDASLYLLYALAAAYAVAVAAATPAHVVWSAVRVRRFRLWRRRRRQELLGEDTT